MCCLQIAASREERLQVAAGNVAPKQSPYVVLRIGSDCKESKVCKGELSISSPDASSETWYVFLPIWIALLKVIVMVIYHATLQGAIAIPPGTTSFNFLWRGEQICMWR
jgi:hypothetical protein